MARIGRILMASMLLSLLVLELVHAASVNTYPPSGGGGGGGGGKIDCGGSCKTRCSLSSRPNLCKRACGTCCQRCGCVPKGTYGNYAECPCYAKLTTRGNRRKCP